MKSSAVHPTDWLGQRPSRPHVIAFLVLGTIALLIAGIQPVVLSALVDERRLSASAVGATVAVEFIAIAIGVALASGLWDTRKLRTRVAAAAFVLILVNLLNARLTGAGIVLERAVAGLAEGVMVSPAAIIVARAPLPARWAGILLVMQGVAQFLLAAVLPPTIMKIYGANGAFDVLAVAALIGLAVVPLLPANIARLDVDAVLRSGRVWTNASIASVLVVFLTYAYFIGAFSFFGLLARQAGLDLEQTGNVVALTVATSIAGSAAFTVIARHLRYHAIATVCFAVSVGLVWILSSLPSYAIMLLAGLVFGSVWGVFTPLQVSLVIDNDPSRRAALVLPGVQALGAAVGPLLCSAFVSDRDVRSAFLAALACLGAAFAIAVWLRLRPSAK